jgi:hypothetical protein
MHKKKILQPFRKGKTRQGCPAAGHNTAGTEYQGKQTFDSEAGFVAL